jgi:hypothetical protein
MLYPEFMCKVGLNAIVGFKNVSFEGRVMVKIKNIVSI